MTLWVSQSPSNSHPSPKMSADSESTHQNTPRMMFIIKRSFHPTSNYNVQYSNYNVVVYIKSSCIENNYRNYENYVFYPHNVDFIERLSLN
jgi:hypothetical protein